MARSESMSRALYRLQERYGMAYGRVMWAWYLQKYDLMPTDSVPEAMYNDIKN